MKSEPPSSAYCCTGERIVSFLQAHHSQEYKVREVSERVEVASQVDRSAGRIDHRDLSSLNWNESTIKQL